MVLIFFHQFGLYTCWCSVGWACPLSSWNQILQINLLSNILSKYLYVLFILLWYRLIWVHIHIWCKHVFVYIKNFKYHTTLKFNQKQAGFPLDKKCLTKLWKKTHGFNDSFWGIMHQIMLIMQLYLWVFCKCKIYIVVFINCKPGFFFCNCSIYTRSSKNHNPRNHSQGGWRSVCYSANSQSQWYRLWLNTIVN